MTNLESRLQAINEKVACFEDLQSETKEVKEQLAISEQARCQLQNKIAVQAQETLAVIDKQSKLN